MALKKSLCALMAAGILSLSAGAQAAIVVADPGYLGDLSGSTVAIGSVHLGPGLLFDDIYSFDLSTGGLAVGSVLTLVVKYADVVTSGLVLTGITLTDISGHTWASDSTPIGDSASSGLITASAYSFALGASLPANMTTGFYKFTVSGRTGTGVGGGYVGGLGVPVPVPEPSTYAMLFAGLGMVGMIAWRRRAG